MKLLTIVLTILILILTACSPAPAAQMEEPAALEPAATNTRLSVDSDTPQPTATDTLQPTDTDTPQPTATVQPSATVQHFDTFISQISKHEAHVVYSPQVIRKGDKFTATIYLPVETPGEYGLPFSEVYTVVAEVYTQGGAEFEAGQFLGTSVTFSGGDITGSSADGNMIITWYNPTYSDSVDYVYVFTIYPAQSTSILGGAKLARPVLQGKPLQTITLAGMPDLTNQVAVEDWPTWSAGESEAGSGDGPPPALEEGPPGWGD